MSVTCGKPGCERGPATGDALHRTSPKGQDFEGLCSEHYRAIGGSPDWVATVIERHNHGET
jgi:hypothetical protein